MSDWFSHLVIAPIIVPLIAGGFMLLLDEKRRKTKATISITAILTVLAAAIVMILDSAADNGVDAHVYLLGNWAAPYGIVLVADRLSSLMVVLASVLGLGALLFSLARWERAGPRFHTLFMLLLMGVNGAFLTGDLFNLFVFFEVLLAASYGLVLHGSGEARIKAGLHYIAINLTASSLFLIGVSLIYGVTGTLNMADLAQRIPQIGAADRGMFEIGMAVLGVAFLIKAGMWPLGFWLPPTYSASSAPAAAVFAIMTKVGVYVVLRIHLLMLGAEAGPSAGFSSQWLLAGGVLTIAYGSILVMAARTLSRIAGACVFISSGTILAVVGSGSSAALSGALFYMISSTLAIGAFFLLIELLNRARGSITPAVAEPVFGDEYRDPYEDGLPEDEVGVVIPAVVALIGGGFLICALLLAGLPPLSSFIGKFAIMSGLIADEGAQSRSSWVLIAVLSVSSLATLIAMVRVGVEVLWTPKETPTPKVVPVEFTAIAGLLAACVILTVEGGPAMRYMENTTNWLSTPRGYIEAVLSQPKARVATDPSAGGAR